MAINDDGQKGETMAFKFFKKKRLHCFQSDLIVQRTNGDYFMVEVKYQNIFEPPPFYGHGLPPYQVAARLNFYKATGVRCMFLVFDKDDKHIYWQWLDVLNAGNKINTATGSRVIFDINNFFKIPVEDVFI